MLEHFSGIRPELPLVVVSEFDPAFPDAEWIAWHVQRPFDQNLAYLKTALGGRRIAAAAVAYDRRSALGELRRAAQTLAAGNFRAYDEEMQVANPGFLFSMGRALSAVKAQLGEGGRTRSWLKRIIHPSEAEIPLRARLAQAKGLAASRRRTPSIKSESGGAVAQRQRGISVVIPSRDGAELLAEMLPRIVSQIVEGEIIVVDNGSSDQTRGWLAYTYPAIRVISHETSLSFAAAVNLGICEARYDRILLLNNDMSVAPGFVDALHDAFDRVSDLFCSTAQILFPAGVRREETGKAVWRRINDLDFPVRCDDPIDGEDLTWVLYGSGGCSLFDTAKLIAIGGVSEIYEPAYVEDMDFGFRAWKRGWPSVYCANALVEHRHRSTTSRFYSERQIDFFVERNYLRFVANLIADSSLFESLWLQSIRRLQLQAMQGREAALDALRDIPVISLSPPPATGHLSEPEILALTNGDIAIFPGRQSARKKTTLIASPYLPFPLSHGGAVRIYNLMRLAAENRNVILIAFVDDLAPPAEELRQICSQIVLVKRHGSHYRKDTPRPDTVEEFESDSFRAALKQAIHQWNPEIAQLEFTWMAQYANACAPAATILVEHDVTFDLQEQLLLTSSSRGTARMELEQQLAKWRAFERAAWTEVNCVVTMSPRDTQMITGAKSVACLPNGVDCTRFQPSEIEPDAQRLLLIGSFAHLPNLLALEFFLREVWPLLTPGYSLHVIGGARHEYYLDFFRDRVSLDLSRPGIEIEGFVSDVRGAYERAAIVLAPLTASAGTNIKVLEAMAMGKAVVSTPAGVNGLDVQSGHDVLVAETGPQLAELITGLTADPLIRKQIERNARETALRFDWRAIAAQQQTLYESLSRPDIAIQ
jgi:GT2 family glycosyltransferase/glycosyltransferase involved in cell wall biosynthesis